jgi:hypothetical protein
MRRVDLLTGHKGDEVRYTLCNKNQALEIFYVPNRKWCKRTDGVIIPVIHNLLVFVRMWLLYTFY